MSPSTNEWLGIVISSRTVLTAPLPNLLPSVTLSSSSTMTLYSLPLTRPPPEALVQVILAPSTSLCGRPKSMVSAEALDPATVPSDTSPPSAPCWAIRSMSPSASIRSEAPTTKFTVPVAAASVVTPDELMPPKPLTRPAASASVTRFAMPLMSPLTRITLPVPPKVRFIVCTVVAFASPLAKLPRPPPPEDMVATVVASATASTLMSLAASSVPSSTSPRNFTVVEPPVVTFAMTEDTRTMPPLAVEPPPNASLAWRPAMLTSPWADVSDRPSSMSRFRVELASALTVVASTAARIPPVTLLAEPIAPRGVPESG